MSERAPEGSRCVVNGKITERSAGAGGSRTRGRVSARCSAAIDGSLYTEESGAGTEGARADPAVYTGVCVRARKEDRVKTLLSSQSKQSSGRTFSIPAAIFHTKTQL